MCVSPCVRVDGVAYSPHRRIDVEALGVDYYVISVYKVWAHTTAGLAPRLAH